jgi:hypothetical protein
MKYLYGMYLTRFLTHQSTIFGFVAGMQEYEAVYKIIGLSRWTIHNFIITLQLKFNWCVYVLNWIN